MELTGDQSEQNVPSESKREDGRGHREGVREVRGRGAPISKKCLFPLTSFPYVVIFRKTNKEGSKC